jgi:serine phosphatase RsbU (regulator of sigma subunit)
VRYGLFSSKRDAEEPVDLIAIDVLAVLALVLGCLLAIWIARARRVLRRFEILYDIAEVSEGSRSIEETLDAICDVVVPRFADFCMIDVIADGDVRRAAARVDAQGGPEAERALAERRPSVPEGMLENPHAPLEPRFFSRMSEADLASIAHDAEDLGFLRGLGVRSAITLGLRARGRLTGALTVGTAWSGRRYRAEECRFAAVLAGRVALTLDNAGLFSDLQRSERERAEIAATLQRGLLPPPLPHIAGWSAAAMYRPAGAENEVGGDFYDAFRVSRGWMLTMGDVTGRGAWAASIAAQARYTLRTAAVLTGDPLVALATLNRALLARRDSALCSIAALTLSEDPLEPVRIAVAGHPPPLLVDGEAVAEVAQAGPVLGAFPDASWEIESLAMSPGQQLVVITDGITEAGGSAGRFGEERLRSVLAGATTPTDAVQRLEEALRSFTDDIGDDAAILAVAPSSIDVIASAGPAMASQAAPAGSGFGSGDG